MCDVSRVPIADHPITWRQAVTPADLAQGAVVAVPGGAVAAGARADALVSVGREEISRRRELGMDAVCSLHVLDALLSLPLRYPIAVSDLGPREDRILRAAPAGCVEFDDAHVTRTMQVPMTVVAAVVRASRWRAALRRTATFSPFAQRIVILPRTPAPEAVMEAQLVGVGIWVGHGDELEECLAPEPFVPKYFKAAGWRFAEHAFGKAVELGVVQLGSQRVPMAATGTCC